MPTLDSFGGPVVGTCRASRPGERPDSPRPTCVLSATAAFTRAGTPPGSVPDGARPGRRAEDWLGDEGPEVLERLAGRVAGVTHGADHVLPLGARQLLELLPHRVGPSDLQQFQDACAGFQ